MLPAYFEHMFSSSTPTHTYFTRQNERPQFSRKWFTSRCIRYIIPDILKSLPSSVTDKLQSHSLQGFTQYLKNHFLNTYPEKCDITNCYTCQQQTQ